MKVRAAGQRALRLLLQGGVAATVVTTLISPLQADPWAAEELGQGRFLVASRELRDPNFTRTVVLLLRYDATGAMGVIVNRPADLRLATLLPELEDLQGREDLVYAGGPVDRSRVLFLLRDDEGYEDSRRIFDDVHASQSRELLERLIRGEASGAFRVYTGYAGWAPGQLENEVARDDWHVVPADADLVFGAGHRGLWEQLLPRRKSDWARRRSGGSALGNAVHLVGTEQFGESAAQVAARLEAQVAGVGVAP